MQSIRIENISKSYGEKQVLNHISKDFPPGETTAVMGASGCGKTTLLRILLGLEKPDSGEVTGLPECASVLFQENRLCEDFSAYENIALVLERARSREQREAQKQMIELEAAQIGLTAEDLQQNVRSLSGGMKRRAALLRALLYDADCVLLDEPFKGLDADTKEQVMQYVKKKTSGKTVLLVTHDDSEAAFFGGEIWHLPDSKEKNIQE